MLPNQDALITSDKALSIIFIILICLINFTLIFQQARKPLFYQNVKWMIIISLAIGDVILALFPLVVMAKQYFNPFWSIPCRLAMAYITYISYLIHFVYGLGVITLGAEVVLRQKLQANRNKAMTAFAVSSIPWILGLIIILPLCLTKVDYYRCFINQSPGALFGVSVFLPASLVFVATLLLNCMNLSTAPTEQSVAYSQQSVPYAQQGLAYSQQSVAYTQQSVALPEQHQVPPNPQLNGNFSGKSYPHDGNLNPHPHYSQYPPNPAPSYNASLMYQPHPQYPHSIIHQYGSNQSNAVQYAPAFYQATNQRTSLGAYLNSNRRKEVQVLLIVAIIYCVMVVPFAAYSLSNIDIFWQDTLTITIVSQCLYWLTVARSCVTPLFMFMYSSL